MHRNVDMAEDALLQLDREMLPQGCLHVTAAYIKKPGQNLCSGSLQRLHQ